MGRTDGRGGKRKERNGEDRNRTGFDMSLAQDFYLRRGRQY